MRHVTAVIIGAGQCGLAMSWHLARHGIDHVILERGEIANAWKAERWDSLRLLTPNWQSRLPGHCYDGNNPDGFMTMAQTAAYLQSYAQVSAAPVLTGHAVTGVVPRHDVYEVRTSQGIWRCTSVVIASGASAVPCVPSLADGLPASILSITPLAYRNPRQLPDGGVLVVGASASGIQIARELQVAGRRTVLSVGEHVRLPRTYRGRDIMWWMTATRLMDVRFDEVDDIAKPKGYPLVIVMSESFSVERRRLLRFLGAKVVLTPAASKGSGMIEKATRLAEKHGWFLCRQFDNPANVETHARTTAEEILEDFGSEGLDYFVSGFGTGGTMLGVASVLRARSPATRIIGCEPDNAQVLASGRVHPMRPDGVPSTSHPVFRPHPMQGWTPDFVPPFASMALNAKLLDALEPVAGQDAISWARKLASREGIFCGITSGATFAAAMAIAARAPRGSRILAMLPDTGERYLSTPLFADIPEQMTEEELMLSNSTADHRFDASIQVTIPPPQRDVPQEDTAELNGLICDAHEPIVVFGLEWCEFTWSVRNFLRSAELPFRTINLDEASLRAANMGDRLRWALRNKVASATLPQVFLAGRHVGGATETLKAFEEGKCQGELRERGFDVPAELSARAMQHLPRWVQPRHAAS